ncbi:MAG: PLP-dependent transferase [Opitutaceae bacterium]|jgi:cystathionine gamma-synthase|nr:PLP-dependent transferase [Opitutaceae bacterium]
MSIAHIPLGRRIPDSLHGVSFSLPTMRDVIGYEERDPEVVRHITSGYPRFVQHPLLRQAAEHMVRALHLEGRRIWTTASIRAAAELCRQLAPAAAQVVTHGGLTGVAFPEDDDIYSRAKTFLQHTGTLLSSREAEDYLVRNGVLPAAAPEPAFDGYAPGRVKGMVARAFGHDWSDDVFLANSGMNAVYAAFRVADAAQRARGRTRWVQLGWLYMDTIAILQKFTAQPARDYHFIAEPATDAGLAQLRAHFKTHGAEIAGVIAEAPTNPMLQTPDLAAVAALCRAHGAVFIVDPTVASPLNINVFPHADVAVNSLTKYAANCGDVIAGAVVVNPHSGWAGAFRAELPGHLEPVYSRDMARLAAQIGDYAPVIAQINRSVPAVVDFLHAHPAVDRVFWSMQPGANRDNYLALAKRPDAVGSMVSFTLKNKPPAWFYDRVRLAKGPSFGMKTTLISPFLYMAHFDLVKTRAGREKLAAAGVPPDIMRLSVGCEPPGEIIAALDEALQ